VSARARTKADAGRDDPDDLTGLPPLARRHVPSLVVFLAGFVLILGLEAHFRPLALRGTYFQEHSSEDMMQTVSLVDLRHSPASSLLALHIQPPLLDALRALLARLWPDLGGRALVVRVDRGLYLLWALVYAGMGVLVFRWLRALAGPGVAGVAAAAFYLHPAAIYYATYLEGTLLTSFGILWLCHALWRIPARGATLSLVGAYLLLFLVRSIFQWPALVVIGAALLLRRAPRRVVLAFVLPCALVVSLYMVKQYLVFGTTSTSSFAGASCLQSLGEEPTMEVAAGPPPRMGPLYPRLSAAGAPPVLTRRTKITGARSFNTLDDLRYERGLVRRCLVRLAEQPPWRTVGAWATNASIFLQPSSRYLSAHVIVDRLPWRGPFDWLFSGARLVALVAAAVAAWAWGRRRESVVRGVGLALPVLFVTAASVMLDRSENMRFKFFVEPVVFVFLVAQAAQLARRLRARAATPRPIPPR
jgi:hypothetical protein